MHDPHVREIRGGPLTRHDDRAPEPSGGRDLLLDLLRTSALGVVVLWHWIFTSVRWAADGPHVGNPVATTPGLWLATWLLQVMPAFFVIGGALHALDRTPARQFWAKRCRRLLVPVAPLLIVASLLALAAHVAERDDLVRGVLLVISPMWFLATYLVCIAVAPLARRAHERWGIAVVGVGILATLCVDRARIGAGIGGPVTGAAAFVLVWATVHQLGFSLARLRSAPRRVQVSVAIGGYAALAAAAWVGPYPAAMVGLDGAKLSNMGPPTTMVVLLGIAQIGLIAACAPALEAFAWRVRGTLASAGEWSMTVYAWHLTAFAAFWAIAAWAGLEVTAHIDARWWLLRPVWLLGPALVAVPICRAMRGFDRRTRGPVG